MMVIDENEEIGPFWERLPHWVSLPTWHINEAYYLLTGVLPETFKLFAGEKYFYTHNMKLTIFLDEESRNKLFDDMDFIERKWKQQFPNRDTATPKEWLEWAVCNGITPAWMTHANENGYFDNIGLPLTSAPTAKRDSDLQQAAETLAKRFQEDGRKKFTLREIAETLSISDEWRELTAARIERIIHKSW